MNTNHKVAALGVVGLIAFVLLRRQPVGTVTTSETIDLDDLGGFGMTSYPRKLKDFANAIARAEGFFVNGSIPDRACNPGNIKTPNWTAAGEIEGKTLGAGIACFSSDDAGFAALYRQLYLIVEGRSANYSLDDTIATMAITWTGNATEGQNWAANVANSAGVSVNTKLLDVLV